MDFGNVLVHFESNCPACGAPIKLIEGVKIARWVCLACQTSGMAPVVPKNRPRLRASC